MYHHGGVSGVHMRTLLYLVLHTDFTLSQVRVRGRRPCGPKYAAMGQLQNPKNHILDLDQLLHQIVTASNCGHCRLHVHLNLVVYN